MMIEGANPDDREGLTKALRLYHAAINGIESRGLVLEQQIVPVAVAYERRAALAWFFGLDVVSAVLWANDVETLSQEDLE